MAVADPQPELDVVVATNRRSPFLDETLASVRAQDGIRCNITVGDDGSPCPADIRASVANLGDAVVIRQPAAGVSAARNRGLREGNAAFVAFLDDDDVWLPSKSAKQIAALEARSDAVLSACDGYYIDAEGTVQGSWSPVGEHPRLEYFSAKAILPRIVTTMFRREVCELVGGFDEQIHVTEDHEFMFRVLLHGNCVPVSEKLVHYRQHQISVTRKPGFELDARASSERTFRQLIAICEHEGHDVEARLLRKHLAVKHRYECLESLRTVRAKWHAGSPAASTQELRWLVAHAAWLPAAMPLIVDHLTHAGAGRRASRTDR